MSTVQAAPVLPTYARQDVTFERGEGVWLVDDQGRRYLDFLAGIAVVGLGHCHPEVTAAAHAQLDRLWHVSNLFWTRPMAELAGRLSDRFGGAQAFFCNSGAEAIEAGLKYARKASGKPGIVALEGSFHGRTLGALSVTGQPAKWSGFGPLVPDVRFARLNDAESLAAAAADGNVGCVLVEPIQGEGGINPATPAFLQAAADLAAANGALLFFDEVQCGLGRTGTFFAHEQLGLRPDLVALAKGLANGLPVGCLLVADEAAGAFSPGDHASTFGGGPVVCAAGCAVVDALTDELLEHVRAMGALLSEGLARLPAVSEVRGLGLLLGCELDRAAGPVVAACLERGLVVGSAGERVLRLTPPLVIGEDDVELALQILSGVLQA
jgi:acetylornithine aminotransferase/acetylornithine/N-succinyldiaminopimelate aminotransferase